MAVPEGGRSSTISSHVSDAVLQPFLQQEFDAADYLNSTLPTLSIGSVPSRGTNAASLADLSSQTQTLLSQLNAQAARLTTVLTQLTDDIIRSGSRLAYEVDVLRGEALSLSEVVNDGLKDEISLFTKIAPIAPEPDTEGQESLAEGISVAEPQYISQLRMLTKVRQRLDNVIKIFGEAMQWTLPPSKTSITSSFISVSAPESGSDSQSREQKGKEFAEALRKEIADVIINAEDAKKGFATAQERIEALRDLAQLWKGTAEEKARARFVESLTKLAEDRLRELDRGSYRITSPRKSTISKSAQSNGDRDKSSLFLENLHKLQQSDS